MINKVILLGNLGQDPDVKMLPNGNKVVNLSIATTDSWKDKEGIRQTKTEWHRVVIFNENLIKIIETNLHKGSQVYLEGSLRTRKYVDGSGVEKKSTEIVIQGYQDTIKMLGAKNGESSNALSNQNEGSDNNYSGNKSSASDDDMDDEIPF